MNSLLMTKEERLETIKPYEIKERKKEMISFAQFCNGTFMPKDSNLYVDSILFQTNELRDNKTKKLIDDFYPTRGLVLGHKHMSKLRIVLTDKVEMSSVVPYTEIIFAPFKLFEADLEKFEADLERFKRVKKHFLYKHFLKYFKKKYFSFLAKDLPKIYSKINAEELTDSDFKKVQYYTESECLFYFYKTDNLKSSYLSNDNMATALYLQYELYKEYTDLSMDECFDLYSFYLETIKKDYIYNDELLSLANFITNSKNNSNEIKEIKNMIELQYSF